MSERLKKIFTKSRKIWVKDDTIYYDIVETPKEEAIENLKTILVEGNIYIIKYICRYMIHVLMYVIKFSSFLKL